MLNKSPVPGFFVFHFLGARGQADRHHKMKDCIQSTSEHAREFRDSVPYICGTLSNKHTAAQSGRSWKKRSESGRTMVVRH